MKKSKRKALGQHFLRDQNVLRKIIRVIDPQPDDLIIEIGAGRGVLTFPLAKKGARVIAIEKDRTLIPYLKRHAFPNLTVHHTDVLHVDFQDLVQKKRAKLVGNLPYSISSPLLSLVMENRDLFLACTFLLQKEFALRLSAQPGTKKYAPLSLLFQNLFSIQLHFQVPSSSFFPPPLVNSALVSLIKRPHPQFFISDQERFQKFLKESFQSRRKKLVNNLKNLSISVLDIKKILNRCGIEESKRPEEVTLSQFVALYNALQSENMI
jgi:16S rRNA (adenine1518-N6/adenine1519-N6)-dimethyltransferase